MRHAEDAYDLIIVDSTDPFGPGEGLFTKEFYGNCYKALREDGIMVNQHESPFYQQDAYAMQRAHKRLPNQPRLSGAYPDVPVRPLALRLCLKEAPSRQGRQLGALERPRAQDALLQHAAARGRLCPAELCGGDAKRC